MNRRSLVALPMFAWLTIGYAVVHGIVAVWMIAILQAVFGTSALNEYIQVFEEDGPLIVSVGGGLRQAAYRRLDGTLVTGAVGRNAETHAFFGREMPGEPYFWDKRILPFIDFQNPTVNWYLVVPPQRMHAAYFIGYEQLSNRKVGYLGTQGFSAAMPSDLECFSLETSVYSAFSGNVAATQSDYFNEVYEPMHSLYFDREKIEMTNAAIDAVWILAHGTIYEIRLSTRIVRKLLENRPEMRHLTRITVKRDGRNYSQLLVRTDQGLLMIDPEDLTEQLISLDPASPLTSEAFYQLKNGQRLLVITRTHSEPQLPGVSQIIWLNENGQIERRHEVSLYQRTTMDVDLGLGAAVTLPAPTIPVAAAWIAPLASPRMPDEPTSYLGRVGHNARLLRVWLLTSLIIGGLTGWACRRRERDVFHNESWLWPILVGLCGWFGWMGYICLRPLPARLPHGAWLPAQPEPNRPLGTEIFA